MIRYPSGVCRQGGSCRSKHSQPLLLEIGKSGGNSFRGKIVRVVVKSTDWEPKGQGSISSCGISDKPLYPLSLVFSSI